MLDYFNSDCNKNGSNQSIRQGASAGCVYGLNRLFMDFELDGLSYYYRDFDDNEYEGLWGGMILGKGGIHFPLPATTCSMRG
jgi:hypothetical protein